MDPFWILQEKVGISSYFWIIRVVNSQLALYSVVRFNSLDTTQNIPRTPLKHPTNDNKSIQLWQMIFALNTSTQNLADEDTLEDGPPNY